MRLNSYEIDMDLPTAELRKVLFKLKLIAAKYGINAAPEITISIEDIEKELQYRLKEWK